MEDDGQMLSSSEVLPVKLTKRARNLGRLALGLHHHDGDGTSPNNNHVA